MQVLREVVGLVLSFIAAMILITLPVSGLVAGQMTWLAIDKRQKGKSRMVRVLMFLAIKAPCTITACVGTWIVYYWLVIEPVVWLSRIGGGR